MDDDRPRFVGVFQGDGMSHGGEYRAPSGTTFSTRFGGLRAWAVDDHGLLYNLAVDYSTMPSGFVWVLVRPRIVRDPDQET